ncbi:unnamed protein product [Protopolystoma xenopodis]|uniref:Pre-rRNA-processing protein TSR2 homolog n=1 Tax=Protopolystoma xenopodis TaxID=117903 RepID=A0A448WVD5_9PLAT|nr:unnamed protein product [Protopolystoma xenopodis]
MDSYREYVTKVLASWTTLRLAEEHMFGGPNTPQKISDFLRDIPELLIRTRCKDEVCNMLDNYLNSKLNVLCDDGSQYEVSRLLFEGKELHRRGLVDELVRKIDSIPSPCDIKSCVADEELSEVGNDSDETDSSNDMSPSEFEPNID